MIFTFPHMGNVYITAKCLLDEFNLDYIIPPFSSSRTLELGTLYTPEGACMPLKLTVGNLIEAYEQGADTVLMVGGKGPCRFGYYCEMQREILEDSGYKMDVITLEAPSGNIKELFGRIKRITNGFNVPKILRAIARVTSIAIKVDEIEELCFYTRAFEIPRGATNKIYQDFQQQALKTKGFIAMKKLINATAKRLIDIPKDTSRDHLKIGIVGEIYDNIDPYMKLYLEHKLGEMGILVHRYITISEWIVEHMIKKGLRLPRDLSYAHAAKPYLNTMIGGHAQETVGHTVMYAQQGFDGVIQVYPLGCMPEIVAQSILPTVSLEQDIPVLTLIIDEMTGEAGFMTRVEAFIDLLYERREIKKKVAIGD